MFLRNFVKRGFLDAVGRQPDFWVILNAASWMERGVLMESDLMEIQEAIDESHSAPPNDPTGIGSDNSGEMETTEETEETEETREATEETETTEPEGGGG